MKICIANGKGGVGKTTISVLLAHFLAESTALNVGLFDRDPQGTASDWVNEDEKTKVRLVDSEQKNINDFDVVVIDTQPLVTSANLHDSLKNSDIVIVATSPSPADLKTSLKTAEIIKQHLKDKAVARLLFNQLQKNTLLGKSIDQHAERIGLPSLRSTISRRQAYQQASILGCHSIDEKARTEFLELALEVVGLFQGLK